MQITKDMTIGEVVQEYPSVVEVLMDEGIHCVGCGAAYFETIEQGLKGHGKSDEEVDEIVIQLNKSIPKEEGSLETLRMTEPACVKLKELLKEEKKGMFLRISVLDGSDSLYQYEFAFDDDKKEGDKTFEISAIKVAVDKKSFPKLKGSKIDYISSVTGEGFKVTNPNAH